MADSTAAASTTAATTAAATTTAASGSGTSSSCSGWGWWGHNHSHGSGRHHAAVPWLAAGVGLLAGASLFAFIKHKHDQRKAARKAAAAEAKDGACDKKKKKHGSWWGWHHRGHHHHHCDRHRRKQWARSECPFAPLASVHDNSSDDDSSSSSSEDGGCRRRRHRHCKDTKKSGDGKDKADDEWAALDAKANSQFSKSSSASSPAAIVVVGSVNADVFLDVQSLPREGETLSATVDNDYIKPGGKGANQAVAAQRLSAADGKAGAAAVAFVGRFGNDAHGLWARHQMEGGYGVDLRCSSRAAVPMGQAYIFVNRSGANSIVLTPSANHAWPEELTAAQKQLIQSAKVVLLQREIPDRVNLAVAKLAHASGVRVCLDVGGIDAPLPDTILPFLYCLAPNETELARLTGLPTETDAQIATAAQQLVSRGVAHVLVTLGTRGSLLFSAASSSSASAAAAADSKSSTANNNSKPLFQPCLPAPKVVDTTGAGDCFRAAFAVALTEGQSAAEAMRFASAAAALCVGVKGAMPSMPTRAATLAFLAAQQSTTTTMKDNKDQKHSK